MKKPKATVEMPAEVQRRLDWLERLIDEEYGGTITSFCERTTLKPPQVNQWYSGYRMLREKAVRRLEDETGKPVGWFDRHTDLDRLSSSGPTTGNVYAMPAPTTPLNIVESLATLLLAMPPKKRRAVGAMLDQLAETPDDATVIQQIGQLLTPVEAAQQTATGTDPAPRSST